LNEQTISEGPNLIRDFVAALQIVAVVEAINVPDVPRRNAHGANALLCRATLLFRLRFTGADLLLLLRDGLLMLHCRRWNGQLGANFAVVRATMVQGQRVRGLFVVVIAFCMRPSSTIKS
jgi:hypothetical protein